MGLVEKLQAKLEIYRIEQRYTRRSKRTNFTTDAQYVDGEYIYPSSLKSSTYASTNSSSSRWTLKAPEVRATELKKGGLERV